MFFSYFRETLNLGHAIMQVLNPLNLGTVGIIFRTHAFAYRKFVCVMACASLKCYFLVVQQKSTVGSTLCVPPPYAGRTWLLHRIGGAQPLRCMYWGYAQCTPQFHTPHDFGLN